MGELIDTFISSGPDGWDCGHFTFIRAWKDPCGEWSVEPTRTSHFQNEVFISSDCQSIRRGLWTPWLVSQTTRLRMIQFEPTQQQIGVDSAEYWSIFVKIRENYPFFSSGVWADHENTRGATQHSIRWPGLVNDLSVLSAFIALWFTRIGVIRRWREIRRGRFELRRLKRGLCRKCGYDRRGLATSLPCPECGDKRPPARM
ncbi:MAG: hypothetical protein IBJ18_11380 [Phycisphaerales bacterium]|nr:hypothetical protein [Phycisphaerales bacterium]